MAYEKGPGLRGARLEDLDLSHARLHAPNFEGAKITDAWFYGADISGDLEGLRLNGVEVAPLVVAELERREPERRKLRAADPAGLADAWAMIEERWQMTVARARELPVQVVHERVDDEWSFVETLRHLVMATDSWLRRMVKGMDHPYHPWGLAGSCWRSRCLHMARQRSVTIGRQRCVRTPNGRSDEDAVRSSASGG
ncbi:MAG: DinB family protein, partial [Actinomycetota bacterium]|nr:DinB family protein [Actinomycetota bacterium]